MPAFYYSISARYYKCERFTITMEVSCMKTQRRTADEQYQLIMECRSSGLSDYQWCTEHNINPGTFYNWVKRLRKKACYDIPSATGRGDYKPALKPDVVKLSKAQCFRWKNPAPPSRSCLGLFQKKFQMMLTRSCCHRSLKL